MRRRHRKEEAGSGISSAERHSRDRLKPTRRQHDRRPNKRFRLQAADDRQHRQKYRQRQPRHRQHLHRTGENRQGGCKAERMTVRVA